jgi:hypothetical protein
MPKKTGGHKDRLHAQWSASSTHRNWLCPGNLALVQDVVRPPENKAAAWGTACHEVAEEYLRHGTWVPTGFKIETERFVFYVDQEMLDVAAAYTGYIEARLQQGFSVYAIEQQFDLKSLQLGMEAGGTADTVLYNPNSEELEIVDLKTGKGGFVDAKGNPQERFYGLGVLLGFDFDPTPVSTVRTTIVQPRFPHADGTIRSELISLGELMDWVIDLDDKVRTAAKALAAYSAARGNAVEMDAWVDAFLVPGEIQCTFCPAAGACPALRRQAMEIAGAWEDDSGVHYKSNQFAINTVESVELDLDRLEQLEAWIRERRALAHEMAVQGHAFDHWHLVEKIGHRKFNKPEADIVAEIKATIPVSDDQLYDRKLKSPAGLERSLGKQTVANFFDGLIERPVTGTDLIRSTHVGRTTAATLVDRFFIEPVEPMEISDGTGE